MTRSDAAFWGRFRVMLGRDRFRDRFRARDRGGRGVVGRGERSFSFWPATVHGQRAGTGEGSRLAASVHRVNVTLETRGVARGDPSLLARAWEKVFERRKRGAEARPKRDRKGAASVQDRPHRTRLLRVVLEPGQPARRAQREVLVLLMGPPPGYADVEGSGPLSRPDMPLVDGAGDYELVVRATGGSWAVSIEEYRAK